MRTPSPLRIPQNIQALNWFILVASCDGAEGSVPGPAKRSETAGPKEAHPNQHRRRTAAPEDPSKPKGAPIGPQLAAASIPRRCPDARTHVVPAPIGRSTDCPQKQRSPYIRKVQYTVLSVAGLKGTINEFELHLVRQRSFETMRQKASLGAANSNASCRRAIVGRQAEKISDDEPWWFAETGNVAATSASAD
jgi:hypothetical protein